MAKRGSSRNPYLIELSSEQRALLRNLAARNAGSEGSASSEVDASRGAGKAVVLSPEEIALLQSLAGSARPREDAAPEKAREPRSKRVKRTTDLEVSEGELRLLRDMAQPAPPVRPRRTTDIVLSQAELEFLRALSGKDFQGSSQSPLGTGEAPVLVSMTSDEAEWLNDVTRQGYSYITPGERRARLILREKLHAAMRRRAESETPTDREGEPAD